MNKCLAAILITALLVGAAPGAGPSGSLILKESGAGFGAGVLVGLIGFTGLSYGSFINWGWGSGGKGFGYAGAAVMALAPAACATGISLVGRHYLQHGSLWASLGGSYVGAGVGVGLFALTMRAHSTGGVRNLHYVAAALTPFLMTSGAMIGYDLGRPKENVRGSIDDRFEMPALGFRASDLGDGQTALAADLRFVTVRF